MDAQTEVADTAALAALVQCVAAGILAGEPVTPHEDVAAEVLQENCFLAALDGMRARLILDGHLVEARALVEGLVGRCEPLAGELGCSAELAGLARLAAATGADRQRHRHAEGADLPAVVAGTAGDFAVAGS
jgi:gamma-glutamyl:cysteine ligase YbdK (ATP-grasp superfamily)